MSDSTLSIEEAFNAAVAEMEQAETIADEVDLPSAESDATAELEQADDNDALFGEQPTSEVDDLLSSLGDDEQMSPTPESTEFWDTLVEVTVDGSTQNVPLSEVRDGYMRQADYTRKTQDVARERKMLETAARFYNAFEEDQVGFARAVASRVGLIDPSQAADVDGVEVFTGSQIEAEVEKRMADALAEHPEVKEARKILASRSTDEQIANIEQQYQSKLSAENRARLLNEAKRRGVDDLELVFESLLLRAAQRRQLADMQRKAQTGKPGGTPTQEETKERVIRTPEDAFEAALDELGDTAPF